GGLDRHGVPDPRAPAAARAPLVSSGPLGHAAPRRAPGSLQQPAPPPRAATAAPSRGGADDPRRTRGEHPMDLRQRFRELHATPFVIPNPWDVGSARILAALGFPALATTSAGFANALGRLDGQVTREEALAHARQDRQ